MESSGYAPSEPFESTNDLLSMVCARDASVEKGSGIGTSLIQHLLHQCTCPVFCFALCTCPQSHSSAICNVFEQWAVDTVIHMWLYQCGAIHHEASSVAVWIIPQELCDVPLQQTQCTCLVLVLLRAHSPQWAESWCTQ